MRDTEIVLPLPTASRLAAASRKRALSTSPFSDLVRNSPAAAAAASGSATANAAASPSSSGSFDALGIPHTLQQAAHLLRGSPYLSPQQNSFLHAAHALHSAAAVSAASPYFPLLAPPPVTTVASTPSTATAAAAATASSTLSSRGEPDKGGGKPRQMPPAAPSAPPPLTEDASSNVVSSTMEDEESADLRDEAAARSRGKSAAKGGGSRPVVRALASSSTGFDDAVSIKEEPDFVETHCHWVGCDREMGTQDLLVKVGAAFLEAFRSVPERALFLFPASEQRPRRREQEGLRVSVARLLAGGEALQGAVHARRPHEAPHGREAAQVHGKWSRSCMRGLWQRGWVDG